MDVFASGVCANEALIYWLIEAVRHDGVGVGSDAMVRTVAQTGYYPKATKLEGWIGIGLALLIPPYDCEGMCQRKANL